MADHRDGLLPAVLDADHRARVNHESYYFSGSAERRHFEADPLARVGAVTDPVSLQRFRPNHESPTLTHAGVRYYFLSRAHRVAFRAQPDSFANPNYRLDEALEERRQRLGY